MRPTKFSATVVPVKGEGKQFVAKAGDVWTCALGQPEANKNKGSGVAIMRVTDLLTS